VHILDEFEVVHIISPLGPENLQFQIFQKPSKKEPAVFIK
jgi:hypothetical protein